MTDVSRNLTYPYAVNLDFKVLVTYFSFLLFHLNLRIALRTRIGFDLNKIKNNVRKLSYLLPFLLIIRVSLRTWSG